MARKYEILNGKVKITDTNEVELTMNDVDAELQRIGREKLKLLEQNRMVMKRYQGLLAEEESLKQVVGEVKSQRMAIIDPDTGEALAYEGEEYV